jgi:importin subunit beta-1
VQHIDFISNATMSDQLTQTLVACQSPDPQVRAQAEQFLQQAEATNLPEFFLALVQELASESREASVRQLAGLHLKNLIAAKADHLREEKAQRWRGIDAAARATIKGHLIGVLASTEKTARHTAAQACAEVAAVELPHKEWPEFVTTIMENVKANDGSMGLTVSSLECLGYTAERLDLNGADIEQDVTNQMLTTIVDGIRADRPDEVRLVAAVALRNALLFTSGNFENEAERNMIMQTICEATQSTNVDVRAASYECIVQIAALYYDKLSSYMQALFQLTFNTMKTDDEKVALQAVEFWSTVCEEEMVLLDDMAEAQERGEQPERVCAYYVVGALDHLIPLLTEQMTKQEEDDEEEGNWNMAMASATCLNLVANTVEDKIVSIIMPFIQSNIKNENWRLREAATMCFGSILEGPSSETIGPYVNQSVPVLLQALQDPHIMVRDTSAWTLARICSIHLRSIPGDQFPALVTGLSNTLLTETPRVASQACNAIFNLADSFPDDEDASTNELSTFMPNLFQTLLQTTEREGWDECNLRGAAYEAISALITRAAADCKPILVQLLPVILERLTVSFSAPVVTNEEREAKEALQGVLCGMIQVFCIKLDKESLMPYADGIMTNTLQVLQTKNATAHEEALMATGALADVLSADFGKYLSHFINPFLVNCLENFEAYQVCSTAVGVVGDLCRDVESQILPFCDQIVTALLQMLQNASLHRSVKPPVLGCFGDIALAIGANFDKYLQVTLMMLLQASGTQAPDDDEEMIDYINTLREGILEAYTGIVQGLKDGNKVEILLPYIEAIFGFIELLHNDQNKDNSVLSKAIGLTG